MSIVVTGGAGFIGQHLVKRLCASRSAFGDDDEPIVVVDNLRRGSRSALAPLIAEGQVRFISGDIRDAETLEEALRGAEYVFHLAAQSNVLGAETDPDYAFTTNVLGTYRVLQAAIHAGARRVVFASSREVYGQPERLPVSESTPLLPKNTYGASKAAGEMTCRTAAARGGLEIVALRLANIYGSGDTGRVIPLWLEQATRGDDLLIYGGNQVLDLLWVGDTVNALMHAALSPRETFASAGLIPAGASEHGFFAALNVGTGKGTPIHQLAEQVRELVGNPVNVRIVPARAEEVEQFVADISLMRAMFGLTPEPPLAYLPEMAQEARERLNADGVSGGLREEMVASGVRVRPNLILIPRENRFE